MLDDRVTFKVAPLPAIALLKLIAWSDDRRRRTNDAADVCNLMRKYVDVLGLKFYTAHNDIVDDPDFDEDVGSARALGRDLGTIIVDSPEVAAKVMHVLKEQTKDPRESQFTIDMGDRCYPDYAMRFACLKGFLVGVSESLDE